jgi:hypothetical protein
MGSWGRFSGSGSLMPALLQAPKRLARTLLFYCAARANTVRKPGNLDAVIMPGRAILH